jgi:hypothetical protein
MKTTILAVFLLLSAASHICVAQGTTAVPSVYFGMHQNHYEPNHVFPMIPFGSFRMWDTGTQWYQIATCNPSSTHCNPETDWNWTNLNDLLSALHTNNVDNVVYTFLGVPSWANGCSTTDSTCDGFPSTSSCGNTWKWGCVLPPDINQDGSGTDATWIAFVTALAQHVKNNSGFAPIRYWDPWNEWDRDELVKSGATAGETCYCTYAQMQRMTSDLRTAVQSIDPTALVATPSMAGPSYGVLKNFLYCNSNPISSCNTGDLGKNSIDIINSHAYINSGLPENVIGIVSGYEAQLQSAEKAKPFWIDEGSWGKDSGFPDFDMQSAFVARLYLLGYTNGLSRWYWYSYDNCDSSQNGVGTLACPAANEGLWWSGKAYGQVYRWMVGNSPHPCTTSGTVWTCGFTSPAGSPTLAVWDTSKSCSGSTWDTHGTCTFSQYNYPLGYHFYFTLDDSTPHPLPTTSVQIGARPILLATVSQ